MATFLSSRLKNLKVGIQGYTDNTEVASFIGNVNIDGSIKTTTFDDGSSTGLNNYVIAANGSGGWSWQSISAVGAVTSPGGADGQIQYNNGGSIGGAAQLYYDDVNSRVGVGTVTPGYLFEVDGDASFLGVIRDGDGDAGANGQILMSTGSGINWVNAAPASAITGLNIREEGSLQGSANAVATLDFVGSYITATVVGSTATITMTESPDFTGLTVNSNTVWHEGNDGVGSGLDADKLDGQEGSYYLDYTNFTNVPTIGNGLITISAGTGLTGSGNFTVNQSGATTITVSHADTSTQASVNNADGVVIQDITLDGFGHITAIGSVDLDGRYYTETEADARFLGISAKAADSELLDGQDSTYYLDTSATAQTKSGDLTLSSDLVVSGNVGIGTVTPTEKFHVEGQAYISETLNVGTAIDIVPYNALNGGTLSFEGSAGQLFSVTNNLTSGSIFSVNDVSGIPSFNVDADGTVSIAVYGGDVGVGTEAPSEKLDVVGSVKASAQFISSVATGTAPLSVASATLVSNLNSDLLDGQQGSYYLNWNNVTNKPSPVVTVTLSGDVTGTANTTLTNLGNGTISIATTIAANSVALGTDTVGDYVEGISAGSGIIVGGTSGEGWTATISHADTSAQASVNNSNGNVIQDITLDGFGHITAIGSIDLDGRYLGLTAKAADSDLLDGQDGSYYLNTSTTFGGDVSGTYDAIVVANDSHTHDGRYYTETESDARFLRKDTSDTLNGNLTLTGELRGPATFVLDPAAVGDNTGTLVIRGNLQVDGVTTTINSTVVSIDDKNIVLASGAANAAAADGAGITIDGASATLTYAAAGDSWVFNKAPYYNSNRLLTTADEGSGNGLDADTLDGQEGSYYRNASNINAGTIADAYLPATISSDITGNAATATKLATLRTIALSGDVTGSVGFDGSANVTINATVANDSHTHDGRYYTEAEADARFLGINAKAADSELLDGINSTSFLRSDADDSASGVIDFLGGSSATPAIRIRSGGNSWSEGLAVHPSADNGYALAFFRTSATLTTSTNTWALGNLGVNGTNNFGLIRSGLTGGSGIRVDSIFDVTQAGIFRFGFTPTVGSNTVWHAGNDGAGTGLDADLLDGQQGSYYLNTSTAFGGDVSGTYNAIVVANDSHTHDTRYYTETESDARFLGINAKAADSDLLDGQDSAYYRNASNINAGTIGDAYLPATISSDITGNAATATKLATARTIGLSGDVTGSVSFDGSANVTITATVANDSHTHDSRYYTEAESDARFLGINAKAADSELLDGINSTSFLRSDQDDTTTGKLTAKTLALTNNATDTSDHRITVYDSVDGVSYGMMLWNSNGTSGDWSTMIYGPNQSARRISFGKVNTTSFINHASVTEIAYFDLDDSTLRLDADAYVGSNVVWNAGNDGAGSGLDADTLDGQQGSYYLDWGNVSNKPDPTITVTLSGDVTGTANTTLTNLGNGTITVATTIAANSVALGTDTTGNYVAGVSAGSGIVVSGTAGEGWSPTVTHADTSSQGSVDNSNGTVVQDITLDGFGHITAIGSTNLDGRYYTETESDARFLGINAKAADSELLDGQDGTYYLNTSATTQTKSGGLNVSGNVGIGTDNPDTLLHLSSQTGANPPTPTELRIATTTAGTSWSTTDPWGRISFYSADTSASGPKIHAAIDCTANTNAARTSNLSFKISSNQNDVLREAMNIDYQGYVGIGTTNPDGLLHIQHTAQDTPFIVANRYNDTSGGSEFRPIFAVSELDPSGGTAGQTFIGNHDRAMHLGPVFGADGTVSVSNSAISILSTGNVGIGTTSPGALLDVTGSNGRLLIGNGNTAASMRLSVQNATGTGNGAMVFEGHSAEYGRFDSSGRLLVGTSSARTNYYNSSVYGPLLNLEGTSNSNRVLSFIHNDSSGGPLLVLGSTGGSTAGSNDLVAAQSTLGFLSWQGADGSELVEAANIKAQVDGTPGANDMPGRLVFSTTADGASSPTERMRIDSSGNVGIGTNSPDYLLHLSDPEGSTLSIDRLDTGLANGDFIGGLRFGNNDSSGGPPHGTGIKVIADETFGSAKVHFLSGGRNAWDTDDYALTITADGRLGVGTTSPLAPLHVEKTDADCEVRIESTNTGGDARLELIGDATGISEIRFGDQSNDNVGSLTYEHSDNTMRFRTFNDERARFDADGRLLVGTSSAIDKFGTNRAPRFQVEGATASDGSISITRWNGSSAAPPVLFFGGTNGVSGDYNLVDDNEEIGEISFQGTDGSKFIPAAKISAAVDGTPDADDMPGRLVFSTTADGASSPTERMRIGSDGNVGIGTNNPSTKLEVNGSITATGTGAHVFGSGDNTTTINPAGPTLFHIASPNGAFDGILLDMDDDQGSNNFYALNIRLSDDPQGHTDNTNTKFLVNAEGNLLINYGTTLDTGYWLDVNGISRFAGDVSVSTDLKVIVGSDPSTSGNRGIKLSDNGTAGDGFVVAARFPGANRLWQGFSASGGASTETSFINSDGGAYFGNFVGINTSAPETNLSIHTSANWNFPSVFLRRTASNTANNIKFIAFGLQGDTYSETTPANSTFIGLDVNSAPTTGDTVLSENARLNLTSPGGVIMPVGNVGIGTDNPSRKLVVQDSGNTFLSIKAGTSDDVGVIFGDTDNDARGLIRYANNGDSLRFWTAGSEKVRITSDGNLGIGTDNPGAKLDVNGNANFRDNIVIDDGSNITNQKLALNNSIQSDNLVTILQNGGSNFGDDATVTSIDAVLNYQGTTSFTGNRIHTGLNLDFLHTNSSGHSSANGQRLSTRGVVIDLDHNEGAYETQSLIVQNNVLKRHTDGANTQIGINNDVTFNNSSGDASGSTGIHDVYGIDNDISFTGVNDRNVNIYGLDTKISINGAGTNTFTNIYGSYVSLSTPSGGTSNDLGNSYAYYATYDYDAAGSYVNAYLYYGNYNNDSQNSLTGERRGIWIAGATHNQLSGRLSVGSVDADSYESTANQLVVYNDDSSPDAGITIVSGATTAFGKIHFADGSSISQEDVGRIIYDHNTNELQLWTNNSQTMTIDNDGVGIGITNPTKKLEISANNTGGGENNTLRFVDTDGSSEENQQTGRIEFFTSDNDQSGVHAYILGATNDADGNGDLRFGTGTAGSAEERLRITSSGRVGIGTTNPGAKLHTNGGDVIMEREGGITLKLRRDDTSTAAERLLGSIQFEGNDSSGTYEIGAAIKASSDFAHSDGDKPTSLQFLTTPDNSATPIERLRIASSGNVGIGTTDPQYKLEVNGSFAATTKSFVIPHPTKEGYKLRHGSLEGPENGVYIRGRSKDFIIELPDYWTKLIDADSITVNLTPIGKSQTLWVKDIKDNKVYVGSKCSEVHYFYTVFAERADVERLQTEINCSEVV